MLNEDDVSAQASSLPPGTPPLPGPSDSIALFLDVDGTLVGFQKDPNAVVLAPASLALLAQIGRQLNGALAIVSGRGVTDLERIFPDFDVTMAGLHGAELRLHGQHTRNVDVSTAQQALMHETVKAIAQSLPFTRIEDKGLSIALHVSTESELAVLLEKAATQTIPHYDQQPGRLVLEFKPSATHKGLAIAMLMQAPVFSARQPYYLGDDLTDEKAFAAVNGMHGVSVLVGEPRSTAARYRLADPGAVMQWLKQLSQGLAANA